MHQPRKPPTHGRPRLHPRSSRLLRSKGSLGAGRSPGGSSSGTSSPLAIAATPVAAKPPSQQRTRTVSFVAGAVKKFRRNDDPSEGGPGPKKAVGPPKSRQLAVGIRRVGLDFALESLRSKMSSHWHTVQQAFRWIDKDSSQMISELEFRAARAGRFRCNGRWAFSPCVCVLVRYSPAVCPWTGTC